MLRPMYIVYLNAPKFPLINHDVFIVQKYVVKLYIIA